MPEDEAQWANLNVVFATKSGNVRRNELSDFASINRNGKIAMKLDEGDRIVRVAICRPGEPLPEGAAAPAGDAVPEDADAATGHRPRAQLLGQVAGGLSKPTEQVVDRLGTEESQHRLRLVHSQVGREQARGREQSWIGRYDRRAEAHLTDQQAGVQRPGAAKSNQGEATRIDSAPPQMFTPVKSAPIRNPSNDP